MKLHKTLVHAAAETLVRIFNEGVYADKAVDHILKQNSRWGSRDRRFIAETTYEMVRWMRLIMRSAEIEKIESREQMIQMIGVSQIIKGEELPAWEEFASLDKEKILSNFQKAKQIRKYRESVPDWLDELGGKELGEDIWEQELSELNKEAQVVLRVNTLKIDRTKLLHLLAEQSIEAEIIGGYSDAILLLKRQNLHQLSEYKQGFFEIQDASSQLIAPFMDLQEGMKVIDACAGAGGKSLHIAAMMKNKGQLISMDVEERKLLELKRRADRAGVKIIKTASISSQLLEQLQKTADRLLLDVPCSGLGVIRRNPDAKWKLTPAFIETIKKTQQEIISNYSQMVKPGGLMIYATCSVLPSENQQQIELFLAKHKNNFDFIEDKKIMPSDGFDGFYMAKLKRIDA